MFSAWQKFRSGKSEKFDVKSFERHLEDNLFSLYEAVLNGKYQHSGYSHFTVYDSKKRDIYKAKVGDRVIHQVIYDHLVKLFEPIFIADSYSSRLDKGAHRAINVFRYFLKLAGGDCYVLKCDIKKYFENIDHETLMILIAEKVKEERIMAIIRSIVRGFESGIGRGIPLGNVTSQIFANIYLHPLDIFVKKNLLARFYVRYNDDFVIIDQNQARLKENLEKIKDFLAEYLFLEIPDSKAVIRKNKWGIDWLGYVILPNCVLLRDKTKAKIFSNLRPENLSSKLGVLKHCNSYNLMQKLKYYWHKKQDLI